VFSGADGSESVLKWHSAACLRCERSLRAYARGWHVEHEFSAANCWDNYGDGTWKACPVDTPACVGFVSGVSWGACGQYLCHSSYGVSTGSYVCPATSPTCTGFQQGVSWGHCGGSAQQSCHLSYGAATGTYTCPADAPDCVGYQAGVAWGTCKYLCYASYGAATAGSYVCPQSAPTCTGYQANVAWGNCG